MSAARARQTVVRLLASAGALAFGALAAGAWAFVGFDRHYFPGRSLAPRYLELAGWLVLAVYFALVAWRGRLRPWRP